MGDYVSVWMPTGPDVLRAWFGANAAGAVYAPLNLAARGRVPPAHAQPRRVEGARRAPRARRAARTASTLPHLERSSSSAARRRRPAVADRDARGGARRRRRDERPELPRPVEPWDDLSLIYTSGTTGPSKGVRAAHAAFWNYANCFILPFVDDDDRYLQLAADVPHRRHRHHLLDAPGRRIGRTRTRGSAPAGSGTTCGASRRRSRSPSTGWSTFMLNQPPSPDDADNPLRDRLHGAALAAQGVRGAVRRVGVHRVRHDRGAGPDRLRAEPGRREELRPRSGSRALRAPARRRARPAGAAGHAGRAGRAPHAPLDDQLRLQEHARGDGGGLAQRLVPHGRPVHARTRTGTSTSSTGSRTSSAAAARTSRRSRSRRR